MRRTSPRSRSLRTIALTVIAVAATGCGIGPTAADFDAAFSCKKSDPAGSVRVQPSEVRLSVGGSASLTATLIAPDGTTFFWCAPQTFWTSTNSLVARALNGGVLAVAPGTTYIAARAGGKADSVKVIVTPAQ